MTNNFTYSALPERSIRLLELSSNVAGDLIFNLNDVEVVQSPPFYALSYAWGTDEATESIACNGLTMKIRANLCEAIRTLFNTPIGIAIPIWIDAICINQQDDEEKAVQVSRMGEIYRRALQVVVWLGPSGEDSDLAMNWLEPLSVALPPISSIPLFNQLEEHGLPRKNSPVWPALGKLVCRPWFGRLWAFQEAVLASEIVFICGRKAIDGQILATVVKKSRQLKLDLLYFNKPYMEARKDGLHAMHLIGDAREVLKIEGQLDFPHLLRVSTLKACLNSRDRVYAMLGMAGKSFQNRIHVSYSNEYELDFIQTYIDCAKACIEEGFPEILDLVAGRQRVPGLPSWSPNLNSSPKAFQPDCAWYQAGILGEEMAAGMFHGKTTAANNHLSISGFRVDTVFDIVELEFPSPAIKIEEFRSWLQNFLAWEAQCLVLAQKTTSETDPTEHMSTLMGYSRRRLPDVKEEDLYQAYHDILTDIKSHAQQGGSIVPQQERLELFHHIWGIINTTCIERRYFSTEKGRLGVGAPELMKGDLVCVLYGTRSVYILREVEEKNGRWLFIGDAYAHGLMELSETLKGERGPNEMFTIV